MKTSVKFLAVSILMMGALHLHAQLPPRCGAATDDPPGCFLCSPVYFGSNAGMTPGNTPGSFCGVIHNNCWIAFQACSSTISFTVVPTNCTTGEGLQVVVVDQNLAPVSNCCTPPPNMITCNVVATGLVPGELYYVMIDGATGDVCNFSLTANGGFCFGPPDPPGPITVDPDISPLCPGAVVTYSIAPVGNATWYEWTVPSGATIVSGQGTTEIVVSYNAPTAGVVCVTPQNPCFNGNPSCTPVSVLPVPTTIKPPVTFCAEDFPVTIDGNTFNREGVFTLTFQNVLGCDSLVRYTILKYPQILRIFNATICAGDCYVLDSRNYCQEGNYNVAIEDADMNGCDSLISLRLRVLTPVAEIAPPAALSCTAGSTVQLDGSSSSSNGTYQWTVSNGGHIVSGGNTLNPVVDATGNYILSVTITDGSGVFCTARDTVQVMRQVSALDSIRFINAPDEVCEGNVATYTIQPVAGASNYTWSVTPGALVSGGGTSITVDWDTLQTGQVCVQASNFCGLSPDTCITVNILPIPTAEFTVTSPVCVTDTATIEFTGTASDTATFTWGLNGGQPSGISGPGPHRIFWNTAGVKNITLTVNDAGCSSSQHSESILVEAPLPAPVVNCLSTFNSITFYWDSVPGANDYEILIGGTSVGTQTDTFYLADNLSPNEELTIEVIANGNNACGSSSATTTCQAENCPVIVVEIDPVQDICIDSQVDPVQLTYTITGGSGGGTVTWMHPAVSSFGVFDPLRASAGPNSVTLTYEEGDCTFSDVITINVNSAPTPDFSVQTPICIDSFSIITYTGSASAGSSFNWNFDGGNIINGATGGGPYHIEWNSGGTYNITLEVEENGCTATSSPVQVTVEDPLPAPVITCDATSSSVTFSWADVPGATGYTVVVIQGSAGTLSGNTYTVNQLNPLDTIHIELIAESSSVCGASSAFAECSTPDCPPVDLQIQPVGDVCKDGSGTPVSLVADINGGMGGGMLTWSGPGVSGDMFDPNSPAVNPPSVTIRAVYIEDNCRYESQQVVNVYEQPSADFQMDNVICRRDTAVITYVGSASTGADYQWDFSGGVNVDGTTGQGPHRIHWASAGLKTVSLIVTENGCASEIFTAQIQVDNPLPTPVLNCNPGTDFIEFTWTAVPGADNYTVNVLTGPSGTQAGNTYTVTGLMPMDVVSIELIANGPGACGLSVDTLQCEARDCPGISVVIRPIENICLYANLAPINLEDSLIITGSTGAYTLSWQGEAGSNYLDASGRFFPYNAAQGDNLVEVILEEDGCRYSASAIITVAPVPLAGFNMPSRACRGDEVEVVSTYVSSTANFQWDFGNANTIGGNDGGPWQLSWNTTGLDSVQLTIEDNGCISDPATGYIEIDQPLAPPVINCNATTSSITFNWPPVPNVDIYNLQVDQQPAGAVLTQPNSNSAVFSNLNQNDTVTVSLTITDTLSACPSVTVTETCIAKECPPISLEIEGITDSCLTPGTPSVIQLNAIVNGSDGSGSGSWSGSNVNASGIFTASVPGSYDVTYTFEEEGCPFSASRRINLYETPTSSFMLDNNICLTESSEVRFTGRIVAGAVYNWNFGGGTPAVVSGPGPHQIQWSQGGSYQVTLSVSANGCFSGQTQASVTVDEPLALPQVTCNASTSSIEICWVNDPLADGYEVLVLSGEAGVRTGDCFRVDNLDPLTDVEIQLTALNNGACGNAVLSTTCSSLPCPPITLDINPLDKICLDGNAGLLNLSDSLTVTPSGSGMVVWIGDGMSVDGTFNPMLAGPGTHSLTATYIDEGCQYTRSVEVEINNPPVADAGQDGVLTCYENSRLIGGDGNAVNCPCAVYFWTGGPVDNSSMANTSTSTPGIYTLEVFDPETGCSATDEVEITAQQDAPDLNASVDNITCFGRRDGAITVNSVEGGSPPYSYRLNGGIFTSQRDFKNLGPGTYSVVARDANGCRDSLIFEITEPDELIVEIIIHANENPVPEGETIQLEAFVHNYAPNLLTDIEWTPIEQFPDCDEINISNCLTYFVTPEGTTVYTVRIENTNGCVDADETVVYVEKSRPVYIPSAFSPNGDGVNDLFMIYAGDEVVKVKSFLVFDRWGEAVHEYYDFAPSDPAHGWNGFFNGQKLNSGVFVYYAEVEFRDGVVEMFKGDVTLK